METNRKRALQMMRAVNTVILGKEQLIWRMMAALLAGGHILLEDMPGVGKTTMALAFSRALGMQWKRVQFTPDVLPSDLTGFSIYKKSSEEFVYCPGAVFCNFLLADEINRTSPKTQSALLEVMEERQVTVDGVTRRVPDPFFVVATQNPSGTVGTQLLPSAQMDRFMISMTMGYPDFESEIAIAKGLDGIGKAKEIKAMVTPESFREMQEEVRAVFLHDSVYDYIVRLIAATRAHPQIECGVSPRGTISLVKMAQASAWLSGNDFVTPGDVAAQFVAVSGHRIQLNIRSRMEQKAREKVLGEILAKVPKPELRK